MDLASVNKYLRNLLMINGIGDFCVAIMLIFFPLQLGAMLNFSPIDEIIYLSGGWGIAALCFGLLRFFAGKHENIEIGWFTAIFGLIEGSVLTIYGFIIIFITELTFVQVALSTLFAMFFMITYAIAFILRKKK
jgi:hypothetical protein